MKEIEERILTAQQDRSELEPLLIDYLPFIKKQLINMTSLCIEYDDMLSLAAEPGKRNCLYYSV